MTDERRHCDHGRRKASSPACQMFDLVIVECDGITEGESQRAFEKIETIADRTEVTDVPMFGER